MSDTALTIRRAIMRLQLNVPTVINLAECAPAAAETEATRFARARRIPLTTKITDAGLVLTRVEAVARVNLYPEIDALKLGEFHYFDLPERMHQRVRLAASQRSRLGQVRLSCSKDGDGIRVTRLPLTDADAQACGNIETVERQSKWGLEQLANVQELRFLIERREHSKLRLAAARKALLTGWTIRCRIQDDGSMLVYRTDAGAPGAALATAAE